MQAKHVLGGDVETRCAEPMTAFCCDGCCNTGPGDHGVHAVCAQVTVGVLLGG